MREFTEKEMTKVFNKNGVFFAFSEKQFQQAKKPDTKYVSMGSGDFCPEENVESYINEAELVRNSGVKKDVKINGPEKIIEREYFNHECQITMDISDMIDALSTYIELFPELFTDKLIKSISSQCFNKAVLNDWF